jgi:hypothetical protein
LKGIEMSFLDSLGLSGLSGLMGQSPKQLEHKANQAFNSAYNQYTNGQLGQAGMNLAAQQYNQQLWQNVGQKPSPWVFNNKPCTVREFADNIWKSDCAEKTHFLLKYE